MSAKVGLHLPINTLSESCRANLVKGMGKTRARQCLDDPNRQLQCFCRENVQKCTCVHKWFNDGERPYLHRQLETLYMQLNMHLLSLKGEIEWDGQAHIQCQSISPSTDVTLQHTLIYLFLQQNVLTLFRVIYYFLEGPPTNTAKSSYSGCKLKSSTIHIIQARAVLVGARKMTNGGLCRGSGLIRSK